MQWTGWGRGRRTAIFAAVLIGVVTFQPALAAVCRIPAEVLCAGCVERLSIRIMPGGACRVSFTASAAPAPAQAGRFVDVDVEAGPHRAVRRRESAPAEPAARPAVPPRSPASTGCFDFNGRHYCE
jgi:hypothetical protein